MIRRKFYWLSSLAATPRAQNLEHAAGADRSARDAAPLPRDPRQRAPAVLFRPHSGARACCAAALPGRPASSAAAAVPRGAPSEHCARGVRRCGCGGGSGRARARAAGPAWPSRSPRKPPTGSAARARASRSRDRLARRGVAGGPCRDEQLWRRPLAGAPLPPLSARGPPQSTALRPL